MTDPREPWLAFSDYPLAILFPGTTRTLLIHSSGEIVSQFTT